MIENILPVPEIFKFVEKQKNMSPEEMIQIFNYGSGLAIYAKPEDSEKIVAIAGNLKLNAVLAGEVQKSEKREVVVKPLNAVLSGGKFQLQK